MLKEGSDIMELADDDVGNDFMEELDGWNDSDDGKEIVESEMFSFLKMFKTEAEAQAYIKEKKEAHPDHRVEGEAAFEYSPGEWEASLDLIRNIYAD